MLSYIKIQERKPERLNHILIIIFIIWKPFIIFPFFYFFYLNTIILGNIFDILLIDILIWYFITHLFLFPLIHLLIYLLTTLLFLVLSFRLILLIIFTQHSWRV
jgi:hypothetical protein